MKKFIAILMVVFILSAMLSACSGSSEKLVDVEFRGISGETTPLAGSDMKLLKAGDTYTVIATLQKTGAEPESSYFEFSIALVDKNGKHIEKIQQDTKSLPTFTDGATAHFQTEITIASKSVPVAVEFLEIQEIDALAEVTYNDETAVNEAENSTPTNKINTKEKAIKAVADYIFESNAEGAELSVEYEDDKIYLVCGSFPPDFAYIYTVYKKDGTVEYLDMIELEDGYSTDDYYGDYDPSANVKADGVVW